LFPWQQPQYLYDGRRGSNILAHARLVRMINTHTRERRGLLNKKARSGRLTASEAIELVMLKMVHPYAHKRPSATILRNRVESIYQAL